MKPNQIFILIHSNLFLLLIKYIPKLFHFFIQLLFFNYFNQIIYFNFMNQMMTLIHLYHLEKALILFIHENFDNFTFHFKKELLFHFKNFIIHNCFMRNINSTRLDY